MFVAAGQAGNTSQGDSKWNDSGLPPLQYDFGVTQDVSGYRICTANDSDGRDPVSWRVEGSHDGYRHWGHVIHHRAWRLSDDRLIVTDSLSGQWQQAVARFVLHPDAARETHRVVSFSSTSTSPIDEHAATWHPAFGRTVATRAVDVTLTGPLTTTTLTWS